MPEMPETPFAAGCGGVPQSDEDVPKHERPCEYNLVALMKTPPKPTFKQKLWSSLEPVLVILLRDITLFLIVLAALVVGFAGVAGLKALGMPPERVEFLEAMHWYAYLTVAFIFLLDMVIKTILDVVRKER